VFLPRDVISTLASDGAAGGFRGPCPGASPSPTGHDPGGTNELSATESNSAASSARYDAERRPTKPDRSGRVVAGSNPVSPIDTKGPQKRAFSPFLVLGGACSGPDGEQTGKSSAQHGARFADSWPSRAVKRSHGSGHLYLKWGSSTVAGAAARAPRQQEDREGSDARREGRAHVSRGGARVAASGRGRPCQPTSPGRRAAEDRRRSCRDAQSASEWWASDRRTGGTSCRCSASTSRRRSDLSFARKLPLTSGALDQRFGRGVSRRSRSCATIPQSTTMTRERPTPRTSPSGRRRTRRLAGRRDLEGAQPALGAFACASTTSG
jgi:hypothetical protein